MDEVRDVSPEQAKSLLAEGGFLLDVREQEEWDAGHAPEATHVPMSVITSRAEEIPRDRLVVSVCRSGGRSAAVAQALQEAGWEAVNLAGGMEAWKATGLPVVDDAGRPGRVV